MQLKYTLNIIPYSKLIAKKYKKQSNSINMLACTIIPPAMVL